MSREIYVPKAYHSWIIGQRGANIKHVQSEFDVKVRVPPSETSSTLVMVEGENADQAVEFIQEKLGFEVSSEPLKTCKLLVDFAGAKTILGDRAERLREFQTKYGMGIMLPHPKATTVLVQGQAAKIDEMRAEWSEILGSDIEEEEAPEPESHKENIHHEKVAEALFFCDGEENDSDDIRRFLQLLRSGNETLDIAVFTITNNSIANAIISEHRQGVRVRVITDNHCADALGSDVHKIRDAGVDVKIDSSEGHFHHKFCVIDEALLMNGSFNWTRGAATMNYENIMATNEPDLVKAYSTEFEKMWNDESMISL